MCKVNETTNGITTSAYLHPCGMLDRDQRTIITINPKNIRQNYNDNKLINNNNNMNNINNNKLCYHCNKIIVNINNSTINNNNCNESDKDIIIKQQQQQQQLQQLKQNTFINNNNINNNNHSLNEQCLITKTVLSYNNNNNVNVINKINNNNKCNRKDIMHNSIKLSDNTANLLSSSYTSNFSCFKQTKLNSLLICICFWLLIIQKTQALPLRMPEENDYSRGSLKCSDVKGVIEKILQQSKLSYDINYNRLEDYTQAVFSENHKSHHDMWRRIHFGWLDPNGEPLQIEDYDSQPPEEALQHLKLPGVLNKEELARELTNLYQRLTILAMAFENIRKDYEDHLHEIVNPNRPEYHINIMSYFKQQHNYIKALLRETKDGMQQLGIQEPIVANQIPELNMVREHRDWIVTREHLKLLNYVLKAYEILSSRCT